MAILEVGINLGMRNLVEIKYYISSDNVLDPNLRAGFLTALESFTSEVFGDDINVISLASFKLVCYCEMITLPDDDVNNKQPLLSYAIIEKSTDASVVKEQLNEIISYFLNRYPLNDIFSKKPKYFKQFENRIDELLGDLKLKTEDRFRSLF
ncbi:MAG: hypothetical protein CEE43_09670 [Promethearchaeota archaeon Loki_b32]|nr:hypothetical protein [Candidatus Lokiarchaeota archaeon]TKJ21401.1 MAG: hypothetical protein CEE43_09670 [Candidatus Lokiarchaeota archaeon Loki_b32]